MKIDILVKPTEECAHLIKIIQTAARVTNVPVQVNRTSNFAAFSNLAINPSQTPIVVINGNVEFAGKGIEMEAVKKRLGELHTGKGMKL